jgi:catechol 2,3-dioxygenase-like lactoylglutathione lyase family enzyme
LASAWPRSLTATSVTGNLSSTNSFTGLNHKLRAAPSGRRPGQRPLRPFRCGLDHLSFAVADRAALAAAAQAFIERGVEHSTISELPPFGIAVLPFKDPDGVALEFTAPLS